MSTISSKKPDRSLNRGRTEESFKRTQPEYDHFPRFLIIHSLVDGDTVAAMSVFALARTVEKMIGKNYKANKLSFGNLLVEVSQRNQSDSLLKQKQFAHLLVSITPHRSLNTVQGVISERDLIRETDSDLLEGVRYQGVIALRRITIRWNGEEVVTPHIVLTFNRTRLPDAVKAGIHGAFLRRFSPDGVHSTPSVETNARRR